MVVMFCGFVGDGIEPPLDGRIAPFVGELACLCGVLRSPQKQPPDQVLLRRFSGSYTGLLMVFLIL